MAMRTYGIETNGMVLTLDDFISLLNNNLKGLKEKGVLERLGVEDKDFTDMELSDYVDFTDLVDLVYEIYCGTFIGEFEGYLETEKMEERTYFENDDIILIELKKDTLYDKYENRDEIIAELKGALEDIGIIVDNDYIENHYGRVVGTYFA